ncbi:hypothetical protein SNEBB_009082 [Seison nebaliae]|nr:hypothetical protein SNEBB_009082 [Seison nebaliae]
MKIIFSLFIISIGLSMILADHHEEDEKMMQLQKEYDNLKLQYEQLEEITKFWNSSQMFEKDKRHYNSYGTYYYYNGYGLNDYYHSSPYYNTYSYSHYPSTYQSGRRGRSRGRGRGRGRHHYYY